MIIQAAETDLKHGGQYCGARLTILESGNELGEDAVPADMLGE